MSSSGIYLHIPFCHSKCTYCSFITGSYEDQLARRYMDALGREIRACAEKLSAEELKVDTIYFGGGTPSIIAPDELARLLGICRENFSVAPDAEITAEMNPSDIDPARLGEYRSMGINRASLGIQSFIDAQLQAMGRDHSARDATRAIELLRDAGFDNISLDLIAGLPDQTEEQWRYNLSRAFELSPEHLSIYLLEIKEGTILYSQVKSGRLKRPDEDLAADMYEMLLDEATTRGYTHYEISNFAKIRSDRLLSSRHNLKYWIDLPYYGFGVSAHSYNGLERYWNVPSTQTYITRIDGSGEAVADRMRLDERDRARETFMLRLRLIEGVDLESFRERYNFDAMAEYSEQLREMTEAGLIETEDNRLRLTRKGILLSNEVFMLFV
jgi:oxygen-independent coproporphyrinogen III oxidase